MATTQDLQQKKTARILKEILLFRSKKDTFLTNADNKQNFIKLLGEHLSGKGCNVSNADGDADLLIVN